MHWHPCLNIGKTCHTMHQHKHKLSSVAARIESVNLSVEQEWTCDAEITQSLCIYTHKHTHTKARKDKNDNILYAVSLKFLREWTKMSVLSLLYAMGQIFKQSFYTSHACRGKLREILSCQTFSQKWENVCSFTSKTKDFECKSQNPVLSPSPWHTYASTPLQL